MLSSPTTTHPLVIAVVPAFNRCDRTLNFLRGFARISYPNKNVVICDDGSTDNTYHNVLLNFPEVRVLRGDGNLWWSGGTNAAIHEALAMGADYILTINDDVQMELDFLSEMVAVALRNPRYIVGCRIHRQDDPDRVWSIGASLVCKGAELYGLNFCGQRWDDVPRPLTNPYPVTTMPGNGVLIPRAVFEEVGYYDQKYMPQYHADTDLVLRARKAGYQPVISLNSVLYNHIPTEPLVNCRRDIVFHKKSDRYWKAVWATLRRHGPFGRRVYLLLMQYVPFFTPKWAVRCRGALRRFAGRKGTHANAAQAGAESELGMARNCGTGGSPVDCCTQRGNQCGPTN
ncbi:MAG TPA: glycosyltransferase family 2 protein [Tepidisphaeraceae bacterium]|nr:glycosyltransferase family 2 protein [Tepidisphaeraceae bacterium]